MLLSSTSMHPAQWCDWDHGSRQLGRPAPAEKAGEEPWFHPGKRPPIGPRHVKEMRQQPSTTTLCKPHVQGPLTSHLPLPNWLLPRGQPRDTSSLCPCHTGDAGGWEWLTLHFNSCNPPLSHTHVQAPSPSVLSHPT